MDVVDAPAVAGVDLVAIAVVLPILVNAMYQLLHRMERIHKGLQVKMSKIAYLLSDRIRELVLVKTKDVSK